MGGFKGTGMGSGKGPFNRTFGGDGSHLSHYCNQLKGEIDIFVSAALKLCLPRLYTHKLNGPTQHDSSKVLRFQQFGFSSSFFSNAFHQDMHDNDMSPNQFEATFGAQYIRKNPNKANKVTYHDDCEWRGDKSERDILARCLGDITNYPRLTVSPGAPGGVLLYVSKKGHGQSKMR